MNSTIYTTHLKGFCQRHFSWRGSIGLNRAALGFDLLRAPFNVFYAPVWLTLQLLGAMAHRIGHPRLGSNLQAVPPGLKTKVHSELCRRIEVELLPEILPDELDENQNRLIRRALDGYIAARNATSEIVANLLVLLSGAMLFHSFTPGGMGWGKQAAQVLTAQWAASHSWAGEWLGGIWYGWFPPDTPLWLTLACIGGALTFIAVTAALSGLVADPLQNIMGLQQRRLRRMLVSLRHALADEHHPQWRPPEPFLARLFDGLDWLRFGS